MGIRFDRGCGKGKVGKGGKCVPAKFNKAKALNRAAMVLGHVGNAAAVLGLGLKVHRAIKKHNEVNARKQQVEQQHESFKQSSDRMRGEMGLNQ